METHTITINKGKVTVEVSGVKGSGCANSTAELESKLGKTIADELTGEFYEQPNQTTDRQR